MGNQLHCTKAWCDRRQGDGPAVVHGTAKLGAISEYFLFLAQALQASSE
jgi:hypothetical protein